MASDVYPTQGLIGTVPAAVTDSVLIFFSFFSTKLSRRLSLLLQFFLAFSCATEAVSASFGLLHLAWIPAISFFTSYQITADRVRAGFALHIILTPAAVVLKVRVTANCRRASSLSDLVYLDPSATIFPSQNGRGSAGSFFRFCRTLADRLRSSRCQQEQLVPEIRI